MTESERAQKEAALVRTTTRLQDPDICDLAEHRLQQKAKRLRNELTKDDARVLADMLLLVGRRAGVNRIVGWNLNQRRTAEAWAWVEHLHASDNFVVRLRIPPHVAALPEVR